MNQRKLDKACTLGYFISAIIMFPLFLLQELENWLLPALIMLAIIWAGIAVFSLDIITNIRRWRNGLGE